MLQSREISLASIEDILALVDIEINMSVCRLRMMSDYWSDKYFCTGVVVVVI